MLAILIEPLETSPKIILAYKFPVKIQIVRQMEAMFIYKKSVPTLIVRLLHLVV